MTKELLNQAMVMEEVMVDMGVATDMEDMVVAMEDMAMGGVLEEDLEVEKDMDGVLEVVLEVEKGMVALEVDMGDMDMAKEVLKRKMKSMTMLMMTKHLWLENYLKKEMEMIHNKMMTKK